MPQHNSTPTTPEIQLTSNLAQALELAALGWFVFPCREKPGEPYRDKRTGEMVTPKVKAPYWHKADLPNGKDNATTDPAIIRRWWARWPGALIGIYCEKSGIFALDIDDKDGRNGSATWGELLNQYDRGELWEGPIQETPSGGYHLIFRLPEGLAIPNDSDKLAEGLDLRSNGYICTGGTYRWLEGHTPDGPIYDAPAWLLDLIAGLTAHPERQAPAIPAAPGPNGTDPGAYWLRRYLERVTVGNRNSNGFSLACQLRDSGLTQSEADQVMSDFARAVPGQGYTEREALASCAQAYKLPPRQPARLPGDRSAAIPQHFAPPQPDDLPPIYDGNGYHHTEAQALAGELRTGPDPRSRDLSGIPELPEAARLPDEMGAGACKWLDDYIDFSRLWSPRAFEGFHEAVGLFVLSTVAARRVMVHMGKPRFPNLYLALTARTSLYAKSSTAEIGLQTLNRAGLAWLLAADSATPQKFVADLTARLVNDYDNLSIEEQAIARLRLAFAGQRGWFYDEFGQHIAAMMRDGGFMADFSGLLRRMDDTPERYEYGSVGRGNDIVIRPYLALLGNLTPDDLRPFAKRGSALWRNGFLARFALITPPESELLLDRFPNGERVIPGELLTPLVDWHNRLGVPHVDVISVLDDKGEPTGAKRLEYNPLPARCMPLGAGVKEAFYTYHDSLIRLLADNDNHDLDGNYARLAEKALRISLSLASVSDCPEITMAQWARAQAITERWRAGLHELQRQINEPGPSEEREQEERLLLIIRKHGAMTAAEAARYVRNLSSAEAARLLDGLASAGELASVETTRKGSRKYGFPVE